MGNNFMSKIKELIYKEEQLELELPEKLRMIITVGIPASGKSTWANIFSSQYNNWYVIERDKLRVKYHTQSGDLNNYKYSKNKEKQVTEEQIKLIKNCYSSGFNVIISDTNLNPKARNSLENLGEELGYDVSYKVFDTPLHLCIKRNLKRNYTVPESVMIRMEKQMREYLGKPMYKKQGRLPSCIIVDIDGTIATHDGICGSIVTGKQYNFF